MSKKRVILKWFFIVLAGVILLCSAFGFWFMSLVPSDNATTEIRNLLPNDLPYLAGRIGPSRGKILAVVTSCGMMGSSKKTTGYEMTELSRAYYVFKANGFEVDFASPLGGSPPVVIDWDDMGAYDYAFLNDTVAQHKINHSLVIDRINENDYQAVYFVGGKGAMFDFPHHAKIKSIVRKFYQEGKVIGAVCHGPAALIDVTLDDGQVLLENKMISCFTNEEELFLIKDAKSIFPFLLQDELVSQGARFNSGNMYLEKVSLDENLVTGQNPWSTWAVAESMIQLLGYVPVEREPTAEENTINILSVYETKGTLQAKALISEVLSHQQKPLDRNLLAMHCVVAAMQGNIVKTFDLISLLAFSKNQLPGE